jgi:flagellar basal body-associated protein FliL
MQQASQQHLNELTRDEIVAILQTHGGYQCYDEEGTEYLRDVLRNDIDTGVLPESILLAAPDAASAPRPAH